MVDFTRRRFLFGLAAVPLAVPVVRHFVMPKWESQTIRLGIPGPDWRKIWQDTVNKALNPPMVASLEGEIDWATSRKMADFMAARLQTPEVQWFRVKAETSA